MSETQGAHYPLPPELPPHAVTLRTALEQLVDDPPHGFERHEEFPSSAEENQALGLPPNHRPTYSKTITSADHAPGYPNQPKYRFQILDGADLAYVWLPGSPLDDGTPTYNFYALGSDGEVSRSRYSLPQPQRIREVVVSALESVLLATGIGSMTGRKGDLIVALQQATDATIASMMPEYIGREPDIPPEDIADLTRELQALVEPAH